MTVEMVDDLLSYVGTVLSLAFLVVYLLYRMALSKNRVVLANWGIVLGAIIVVLYVIRASLNLWLGNFVDAGFITASALLYVYLCRWFFDGDNWFKDQFTKLKKGFKSGVANLKERVGSLGSPLPSPA